MVFIQYKYRVSEDSGKTWAERWLTEDEAEEVRNLDGHLCERADHWSFQKIIV